MGLIILHYYIKMSVNFQRVKRDILKEIQELPNLDGDAWADIILRNSRYCETDEDQISFWNFILNPHDKRDFVTPKYVKGDFSTDTLIPTEDTEYNLKHEFHQEGGTTFVRTRSTQMNLIEQDDEKQED